MAPASDNNNQDLATKKAKLEPNTVIGVGAISEYLASSGVFMFLTSSLNLDRFKAACFSVLSCRKSSNGHFFDIAKKAFSADELN